jgi:hypothetical protein
MSYLSVSREGYLIAEQTQQAYIDQAMSVYERAIEEINGILKDTYAKSLAGVDKKKYLSIMRKANKYEKLKDSIKTAYKEAAKEAAKLTETGLLLAMTENYNRQQYLKSLLVSPYKMIAIDNNILRYAVTGNVSYWAKIQKASIVKLWGDPLFYSPQTGTLSDLLLNNYTKELTAIYNTINNGFILGKSYNEQAKGISSIIGGYLKEKGKESATGAKYNALRIARTEGTRVMNAGALASSNYASSLGIDIKRQWVSTLDLRTRSSHGALDGQTIDLGGMFSSPITGATGVAPGQMSKSGDNINCRCTVIDIVNDEQPSLRRARNEDGENEVISYKNYDEWIKSNNL